MRTTHSSSRIHTPSTSVTQTSAGRSPAATIVPQPARRTMHEHGAPVRDTLAALGKDIRGLNDSSLPDFPAVLAVCDRLKASEDCLKQALQDTDARTELEQLRQSLRRFLSMIDRCLDAHSDMPLDASDLQRLCMGLAALAPPQSGPLLSGAQASSVQSVLTAISTKLTPQLIRQFEHSAADTGLLLNCLNWYSRALKADLLHKDSPCVTALFRSALEQMQQWSERHDPDLLNQRQLAKCMVQLNTMVKQGLIDTDPDTRAGQADRQAWSRCVIQLCDRFLSTDRWLKECDVVELINVTNTLKDGLDAGLLDATEAGLQLTLDLIADRIGQQAYAGHGHLAALSNCANLLRCLFEHDLLGTHDSPTGRAMLHLLDELGRLEQPDHLTGQAQGLINLASFLKAADRWLVRQTGPGDDAALASLARAGAVLMKTIGALATAGQQWMRSPLNSSALLSALQHLWQRGLLKREQRALLNGLVNQLLLHVPHWQGRDTHGVSSLQSLRALMALIHGKPLQPSLIATDACQQALRTLLIQLQQRPTAQASEEERLGILQAVQACNSRDVLTIDDVQPLLQRVLNTTDPIDLARLEQAIRQCGTLSQLVELPSEPAAAPFSAVTHDSTPQKATPRNATYWAEPAQTRASAPTSPGPRRPTGDGGWISPRNAVRPAPLLPASVTALPLSHAKLVSTSPKLTKRRAPQDNTGSPPAQQDIALPAPARAQRKGQSTSPAAAGGEQELTLPRAQTEWFALLMKGEAKALSRLQELAAAYPTLLQQKSPGKKGQTALFYALTLGCKEIADWLIHHPQQCFDDNPGAFLLDVLNPIGLLDRRHLAGLRLLVDALAKDHDHKQQAMHAAHLPDSSPLSRRELQNRRAAIFSDEQKQALGAFRELRPLLEEYKLIPALLAAGSSYGSPTRPADKPAPVVPVATFMRRPAEPVERFISELRIKVNATGANPNAAIADSDLLAPADADWVMHAQNRSGTNLLMFAARSGDLAMFKSGLNLVSDREALIFKKNLNDNTALIIAASNRQTEIAVALLNEVKDKDALARIQNRGGVTALMVAAGIGDTQTAVAIMNAVNDVDALAQIQDSFGTTALIQAAANGHADTVTAILEAVSDPDALARLQSKRGTTALIAAASDDHSNTVTALLGNVRDKDRLAKIKSGQGMTALMTAARKGHARTVTALLDGVDDKDALASMADDGGTAALSWAATDGHTEAVIALLSAVSDPDALARIPGIRGITALILAAGMGHTRTVIAILNAVRDKHALASMQDFQGLTAVAFAMLVNHPDTAAAIQDILDRED